MLHASTRKLIDRLAEMTELNKLDWTESDAGQIIYSTEGYSVALTEDPNELVITSKDGKELERATPEELAATQSDEGVAYAAIVGAMTAEAARIARGTEAAISSLLAGMEERDATPEASVIADVSSEEDLAEDQVDDTNVVDAGTIETVAAPMEESDTVSSELDASGTEETEADTIEIETEVAADPVAEIQADADQNEREQVEDENIIAAVVTSEDTPEPDAETESDVTEAVARLADEVNQREDSSLDAAAASAVGAVALAAGLTTADDSAEEVTQQPEATTDLAAAPLTDPEPAKYVPFGLEEANLEDTPVAAPILAETFETAEDVTPEPVEETPDAISTMDISTPEFAEPVESEATVDEPFAISATETEPTEAMDTASDTVVPFAAFASASGEETMVPEDATETADPVETVAEAAEEDATPAFEPQAEMIREDLAEDPSFVDASNDDATAESEPNSEIVAPVHASEPSETEQVTESAPEIAEPEHDTLDTAPAQTIAIDTPPATPPQSYSLSGIGAGFGLGALSAKTEASGIPGPSAAEAADKVVIDATEDVLPEIDGKPALPEGLPTVTDTTASSEQAPAEATSDAEESDILKPRTRFNPWD